MDTHAQTVDARLLSLLSRGLGTRLVNLTSQFQSCLQQLFRGWVVFNLAGVTQGLCLRVL